MAQSQDTGNPPSRDHQPQRVSRSMRDHALHELVDSETQFVKYMEVLVQLFVNPLAEHLPASEHAELFANIQQLTLLNSQFRDDLATALAKPVNGQVLIGRLLTEWAPYFAMFGMYVENFDSRRVDQVVHQHKMVRMHVAMAESSHRCAGQTLRSLLIMPVQRVARQPHVVVSKRVAIPFIRMSIKEIIKFTPDGHPDKRDLQQALDAVTESAHRVDDAIRLAGLRATVSDIEKKTGLSLVTRTRQLRLQAQMSKMCRRGLKLYRFYLFNDILVYGSKKRFGRKRFHKLPLADIVASVCDVGFTVRSKTKSFEVHCSTEESNAWVSTIAQQQLATQEAASAKFKAVSKAFGVAPASPIQPMGHDTTAFKRVDSSELAPVLQPYIATKACGICNSAFSMTRWRHNCKHCGLLVCGNCSYNKIRGRRACSTCFKAFKTKKHEFIPRLDTAKSGQSRNSFAGSTGSVSFRSTAADNNRGAHDEERKMTSQASPLGGGFSGGDNVYPIAEVGDTSRAAISNAGTHARSVSSGAEPAPSIADALAAARRRPFALATDAHTHRRPVLSPVKQHTKSRKIAPATRTQRRSGTKKRGNSRRSGKVAASQSTSRRQLRSRRSGRGVGRAAGLAWGNGASPVAGM